MIEWIAHPQYKSSFGYQDGDVFRIVGSVDRWPGWEERLKRILDSVNKTNK
jgi:hypothetical protein